MDYKRRRSVGSARNSRLNKKRTNSTISFKQSVSAFSKNINKQGFLLAAKIFLLDIIQLFVIEPFNNVWIELKSDSEKRTVLDGLEKTRRHRPDLFIILFIALIMLVSIVIMYALSPQWTAFKNKVDGTNLPSYSFFQRQIIFFGLGIVFFSVMSRIPLTFLYRHARTVLIAGYAACAILVVFGALHIPLADCKLGACRWLRFGFISVQPAEILKLGVLLALSIFLGERASKGKINNFKQTIGPVLFVLITMMIFIVGFQKDLGTGISAIAIIGAQLFIAGMNKKYIGYFLSLVLVGGVIAIIIAPHRMSRIATFGRENCSNLSAQESKGDYHICHAKIALGSGGLFGVGIGNSVQATGYLPESVNDSIFAVLGETFGFVGLLIILGIFMGLIYRILLVSSHMNNPASRIMVAGAAGWFTAHTIMNAGAMVGIIPLTGITMPLLSYGGTSIIIISIVLGLVFNVSAFTSFREIADFKEEDENSSSRRRIGRSRSSYRSRI